jgi:ATP-dependent helicase/nuclease subunit A
MSEHRLHDAAARERIVADLSTTLFVEAGAGAGKTTMLTSRVVALVRAGVPITSIAAITFTEKAAAELRHRVRQILTADAESLTDLAELALVQTALEQLDQASIGTLHGFCRRLLATHPVESQLPPAFTVLDEVASDMAFNERWTEYMEQLLSDPERGRLVLYARSFDKLKIDGLRSVAQEFGDNWDLVVDRVELDATWPPPISADELVASIRDLVATTEVPAGDRVEGRFTELVDIADQLDEAGEFQVAALLKQVKAGQIGNKTNWRRSPQGEAGLDRVRACLEELVGRCSASIGAHHAAWRNVVGAEIGAFTLTAAHQRRETGQLEFHDLLVLARDLLRTRPDVRAKLHGEFTHLLLDEFQDTDPIQLEIAVRLAAAPETQDGRDRAAIRALPGRLFFVGDPKQSIYRFRRASIEQYLTAREAVGADEVVLDTNFRSLPGVVDWINRTFEQLIVATPDAQPDYIPLVAERTAGPGSITVLGTDPIDLSAEPMRDLEARNVVRAIQQAITEGWPVTDEQRPCAYGDITILLPARTSLPMLEDALLDAGVPYQAENSSLVYATVEVRNLIMAVRCIADPTDELAVVNVLRSTLFGCSDRDLYEWRQLGGRWSLFSAPPEVDAASAGAALVGVSLAELRQLASEQQWHTPSEILQRLVADRRVFELALAHPTYRDVWRRLRFVIDQARAWSDAGGVGLRGYLDWVRRQGSEGRYQPEAVLPETDVKAVKIMTIHAAKGLQFPITVVSGLTTEPRTSRTAKVSWTADSWDLISGDQYTAQKPIDEQLGHHERLRLLYVACTRAEDHLVVSLFRKADSPTVDHKTTSAQALAWADAAEGVRTLPPHGDVAHPAARTERPRAAAEAGDDADDATVVATMASERQRALAAASVPSAISATTLATQLAEAGFAATVDAAGDGGALEADTAIEEPTDGPAPDPAADPGLAKDAVDLELPAWQRGRYGTAVGRAVHGALQTLDLRAPNGIAEAARAQAAAEGLLGRERVVESLVRSALDAPVVRAAGDLPHWQELYVGTSIGGVVLEGYIDLLVRTDEGLVVVDYKTDSVGSDEELQAKVARYAPQLGAYGCALESVLGEPVAGARLVFCRDGAPATEVAVPAWAEQVAAVAPLIASPLGAATA